jgi:hypothetical protein
LHGGDTFSLQGRRTFPGCVFGQAESKSTKVGGHLYYTKKVDRIVKRTAINVKVSA